MDSQPGTIWGREPAMVLALVQALIALVVAFGLGAPVPGRSAVARSPWAAGARYWAPRASHEAAAILPRLARTPAA